MIDRIGMRLKPAEAAQLELIRSHLQRSFRFIDKSDLIRFALDAAEREILSQRGERNV